MKSKINKQKVIITLITLAVIAVMILFVWAILNPEHAEIFIDKVLVVAFITAFFWVGWFFMKVGKKQ